MPRRTRRDWINTAERNATGLLLALCALAIAIRIIAFFVLSPAVESDGAAYLMLADTMGRTGVPTDMFGQHGFYSIGYPIVLTPFVLLFGANAGAALIANLLLCCVTLWLLWRLARAIGLPRWAQLLLIAAYALWLPGIWNSAMIARENLSTPLLLAVLLASFAMLRGGRGATLAAGMLCGAAILAGGSALLLGLAPLTALWLAARRQREQLVRGGAVLAGGLLLILAPWLLAMQAMTGTATIATSSGFNFYLGHNPAATGSFVSIADTPAGPRWHAMHAALGEAGAGAALAAEGRAFIAANPLRTAELALIKLTGFWTPNIPDATDIAASPMVSIIRIVEIFQYSIILLLGFWALFRGRVNRSQGRIIWATILGFWIIHAAAYVMPRYRDPVMPVILLLGVATLARRGVHNGR